KPVLFPGPEVFGTCQAQSCCLSVIGCISEDIGAVLTFNNTGILYPSGPFILLHAVVVRIENRFRLLSEMKPVFTDRKTESRGHPVILCPVKQVNLATPYHSRGIEYVPFLPPHFPACDRTIEKQSGIRLKYGIDTICFYKTCHCP